MHNPPHRHHVAYSSDIAGQVSGECVWHEWMSTTSIDTGSHWTTSLLELCPNVTSYCLSVCVCSAASHVISQQSCSSGLGEVNYVEHPLCCRFGRPPFLLEGHDVFNDVYWALPSALTKCLISPLPWGWFSIHAHSCYQHQISTRLV